MTAYKDIYLVIGVDGLDYTVAIGRDCKNVLSALETVCSKRGICGIYAYRKVA